MKKILLLLGLPIQIFCQSTNPDIAIKSISGGCNQSCDCVEISTKVINNKQISQLAAIYTYNKVLSGSCALKNQSLLFAAPEFKEYILKVFTDKLTINYASKDERLLWADTKVELLYGIENLPLKYQ